MRYEPRTPCPTVPGPLEEYAQGFDDLFGQLAQRSSFREYLLGRLLPLWATSWRR
jgi:hypothetical protein